VLQADAKAHKATYERELAALQAAGADMILTIPAECADWRDALRLARPGAAATGADASAGVRATLEVRDYGPVRLDLTLARLNRRIDRTITVAATGAVTIPVGPLPAGRYAATLTATDRAGNAITTRRILSITV
jgi:hypothetical protein